MHTADNYRIEKTKLLSDLEKYVRKNILSMTGNEYAAIHLPFWADGAANPYVWFNSSFRPLFILKEVNIGLKSCTKDELQLDLDDYNDKWGIGPDRHYMEFVEDKFSDIYIGKYETWKRVVRLSVGLENNFETHEHFDIDLNVSYGQPVTLEYLNSIYGNSQKTEIPRAYKEYRSKYKYTTGNMDYINAVDHLAVIDIKKIGAGDTTGSYVSQSGLDYIWHLEHTAQFLIEQINLLKPTVIICCCGPDNGLIKQTLYKNMTHIRWLNASHPGNSYKSYEDFFKSLSEASRTEETVKHLKN